MIYLLKTPLMIVGLGLSLGLAPWLFAAVPGAPVAAAKNAQQALTPVAQSIAPVSAVAPNPEQAVADKPPSEVSAPIGVTPASTELPPEPLPVQGTNNAVAAGVGSTEKPMADDAKQDMQSKIVPTSKASDVRILIDISGSMRQNDPENLRIPALNLIVEMLPEGAQSGVWTFGQWVNMLITPAVVDDKWREQAKEKAKKINSHGLRTNIGEAMEKALWKLDKDSEFDQHAILLTDGLVDIASEKDSEQQNKNDAERQRILTSVLNEYKSRGVKIHTIALSDNADKTLLEKLSLDTQGMSEVVNTSEDLVKAFLKAFDKAAPEAAEQVPLAADNTFEIDKSIEEFTALVFRKKDSSPTQLISPSGKRYSQIKGAQNARWFSESVYDLVTLDKPEAGTWKIEADLDPDNRVTVVSDLKMAVENLPNTLFPGQQVDFQIYFHEEGKVLTNSDFLKLMTVEMKMSAESGRSGTKVISDPNKVPADGYYRESIKRLAKEGQYELQISVDGKTFKRMRKEYIQVRQPIGFEIRKRLLHGKPVYAVRVIPQVPDIEVARTRVIAKLKGPDQSSIIQAMPWIEEGVWEAIIEPTKGPGDYEILMNIKGRIEKDQEFRIKPEPIKLTFPVPADFSHEYLVQEEVTEMAPDAPVPAEVPAEQAVPAEVMPDLAAKAEEQMAEKTEEDKAATEEMPMEEEAAEEAPNLLWLYILIPSSTLVLGLLGFFIFRKMSKKKEAKNDPALASIEEELSESADLGDGMDDDDFDDDFDLSDDDEDEALGASPVAEAPLEGGDIDDLDSLDLSNDDSDEVPSLEDDGMPDMDDIEIPTGESTEGPAADASDDIPDFDEDFDLGAADDVEDAPAADESEALPDMDDVDDILGGLDADDEDIPQLEEEAPAEPEAVQEVSSAADDGDGEAAIDEALANLENELDDIDIDALGDDESPENKE